MRKDLVYASAAVLALVLAVLAVDSCSATAMQTPGTSLASCPPELARTDATCSVESDSLYELTFTDGRKAWCRNGGSQAWCSVPVAPSVVGSGSAK